MHGGRRGERTCPIHRARPTVAALFAQATEALATGQETGIAKLADAVVLLRDLAPGLGSIVASSAVRARLDAYERADQEAKRQQGLLFHEATAANLCLLGAGVLSSLVLAGPSLAGLLGETWTDSMALWIGLATLALGALAAMYGYRARESDRLRRWFTMRGTAEVARLETFRAIAAAAAAAGPATAAAGLALFCRHLFDDQRRWLVARAARHRLSSDVTNRWGGLATALTFLGGSAALIASFAPGQSWMALAGVVGAAVMAYALNREELRRDRANADRYEKAAVALDQLATRLDEVAAEIAAGRPEALPAFVDAVTAQLEAEHKQWLDGATQVEAALARLDARLKELGDSRPKTAGPTLVVAQPDRDNTR